jgi:hypothetical protein
VNEPFVEAIATRIRSLVDHEQGHTLDVLAATLHAEPAAFERLVQDREGTIDSAVLIDVVVAFVREFAVDPQWLLTGRYDASIHRQALALREDRSEDGARSIQRFVREQFHKLVQNAGYFALSPPKLSSE